MPLSDRFTPVVQNIYDRLVAAKGTLGLQDVWYGDQQKVPRTPAVAVESGPFTRILAGTSNRTDNTVTVLLMVYVSKIQDIQATRKEADQKAEEIMDFLHDDFTAGGTVIHGYVTSIEPGYAARGGELMRAARITWQGLSKAFIS